MTAMNDITANTDAHLNTETNSVANTRRRRVLMLGVPAVLLAVGATFYLAGGSKISTDNAYVKALTVDIAPQISGKVVELPVETNTRVKKGDLLFAIDDSDYEIALRVADAESYVQWARIEALRPEMRGILEEKHKAEAEAAYYEKELQRLENLRKKLVVSEAQLDDMRHRRDAALAGVAALEQHYRRAAVALNFDVNLPKEKHPFYLAAMAKLDKAKLDLARTRVVAPMDGVITNKNIAIGDLVAPGRTVLSIVQDTGMWVEANLKETDLAGVNVGAAVTVTLDIYPGVKYRGEVESISPVTGAEFALLPPQNASGNWVKVVQRVPVRVRIMPQADQPPLRAGLSADVTIDAGKSRWQRLFD